MRSAYSASLMMVVVMLTTMLTVNPGSGQPHGQMLRQKQLDRPKGNPASGDQVSDSVTNLAQKIARAIASPKSKTEIFSPVSIAGTLSLLLLGAKGKTRQELMGMLGFNDGKLSLPEIHCAFGRLFQGLVANDPTVVPLVTWRGNDKCNRYDNNFGNEDPVNISQTNTTVNRNDIDIAIGIAILAKKNTFFDRRFKMLAKNLYKSELMQFDFEGNEAAAARTINNWIDNKTHGRIADIVSHISPDTIIMIVNTLYFRGLWEEPFQPMGTRNRPFFPNGPDAGDSIDVPMMVKSGCMPYYYSPEENIRILGIPYKQNATMYVLMPMNSTRDLVQALQQRINVVKLKELISKMKMRTVTLLMPKIRVVNSLSLKFLLQQLGVISLFQRESAEIFHQQVSRTGYEIGGDSIEDIYTELVHRRSVCPMGNECRWGKDKCVCCSEHDDDDDFRRRRRDASTSISKERNYVNEILHKVDLGLTEVGTEDGVFSASPIDRVSSQITFLVNRPFVMIVREETTGLPLLYGTVYTPK